MDFLPLPIRNGFLQSDQFDCGYVCVATVAEAIGIDIHPEQLKSRYGSPGRGIPLYAVKTMLTDLGVGVQAMRLDPARLFEKLKNPAIVHHRIGHFMVVMSVTKRHVRVYDPGIGIRVMEREALQPLITDVVLEITDTRRANTSPYSASLPHWLNWKRLRRQFGALTAISAVAMLVSFITPMVTSDLYNNGVSAGRIAVAGVAALGLSTLFKALFDFWISAVSRRIRRSATEQAIRSISSLIAKVRASYLQNRTSAHYQKPIEAALGIVNSQADVIPRVVVGVPLMIAAIVAVFHHSAVAALAVVVGGTGVYLSSMAMRAKLRSLEDSVSYQELHFRSMANNLMEAMPSIHVLGSTEQAMRRYADQYANVLERHENLAQVEGRVNALRSAAEGLDSTLFAVACASLVANQSISVGTVVALALYKGFFSSGITALTEHWRSKLSNQASQKHIDVLSHHMSTEQAPPKTPFESVDIKSVSYSINSFSESPIINNVNFSMKKGEWLVLSGKSGAGKTTLCKLLAGIIAPSAGKIVWNNIEQQQIDVSFMLQDSKLIQGTILDNITLHDDSIPFADVVKACELAELHHTIMAMPSGYRTLVGEGVGGLSGGQRQRLLLARAALRQCSLLILDEFSNNLDDETTVSILRNLKNRFDSIIFVSHSEHVIASACRRIMWDELKRVRAAA